MAVIRLPHNKFGYGGGSDDAAGCYYSLVLVVAETTLLLQFGFGGGSDGAAAATVWCVLVVAATTALLLLQFGFGGGSDGAAAATATVCFWWWGQIASTSNKQISNVVLGGARATPCVKENPRRRLVRSEGLRLSGGLLSPPLPLLCNGV